VTPPRRRGERIEIRGLRVVGTHGVLAHERERPQPFELDLDVALPADTGVTDRLEDTVDYGAIVTAAADVVRDRSFLLLEALAHAVADRVLALDGRVEGVAVAVRKLRPPIPEDLSAVGVRVVKARSEPDSPPS
jgi:7,8-dihydroneopterin aldolase/epimerase/oxygenase